MKLSLAKYYLMPEHPLYRGLYYLNQNKGFILSGIFLLIVAFPVGNYFYLNQKIDQQQKQLTEVKQIIEHKQQQLKLLQQRYQLTQDKSELLTKINQQIQLILDKNSVEIDSVQWNMEERKIYLLISQSTQKVFNVIAELNQLTTVKFQEIHLTKKTKQKYIQLNATLLFQADTGEP
ncbi:ATPase [Glaesserella parasuis]|uniref:ATPase n=1 Tax=Glaesserella parasuis TaxID=738 RepID=UPI00136671CB|nr:ATPase [Glaesserella parasuis]MCT8817811.1 ATPase [Glaesserella parasuis]MDO9753796.1 ATPase [Glaesserella parasuis]MWP81199.1 ATPase [Glaesserella parasuis]